LSHTTDDQASSNGDGGADNTGSHDSDEGGHEDTEEHHGEHKLKVDVTMLLFLCLISG
jgi:hypothetical protein